VDGGGVVVRPSTLPGAGLGLFAVDGFASRDIVTEYSGRVLSRGEACDARSTRNAATQRQRLPQQCLCKGEPPSPNAYHGAHHGRSHSVNCCMRGVAQM